MIRIDSGRGRTALLVAHCAGMVDLVALPVWVGALISQYGFRPQQAGLLATLFLVGAVIASVTLAPRFGRLPGRAVAVAGFALSGVAFAGVSLTSDYTTMAVLHALAGLAAGAGLSVTHGSIACSVNPHRLFAMAGIALGAFGLVFLGSTPLLVAAMGGPILFRVFAGIMLVAAVVAVFAFPSAAGAAEAKGLRALRPGRISGPVWFGIIGISAMALVQAMTFSFLERAGSAQGYTVQAITGVLIALGVVNLFPGALAAMLEKRWSAKAVLVVGPVVQAGLVMTIMMSSSFWPYALATSVLVSVMVFTHTFAFGLIARLDASGRALAATPAMLMVGAAIGPTLGGTLVQLHGYGSLGWAAAAIAVVALVCFLQLPRQAESHQPSGLAVH